VHMISLLADGACLLRPEIDEVLLRQKVLC
jgi:hypothetical protein